MTILTILRRNILLSAVLAGSIAVIAARFISPLIINTDSREQAILNAHAGLDAHPFIAAGPEDSRSPCPALNTLANHGYIPHDGRAISHDALISGLRAAYDISHPLASFLTYGTYVMLRQLGPISLDDISRHGAVEHNASLAHADTPWGHEFAPPALIPDMLDDLVKDSADGWGFTVADIAHARVRREGSPVYRQGDATSIDALHAEVARGEMSLVLGIFGGNNMSVPVELLKDWWIHEKIPEGWKPERQQTLIQTVKTSSDLRAQMKAIRKAHGGS